LVHLPNINQPKNVKFLHKKKKDKQHLLDFVVEIEFDWRKNQENRIWWEKNRILMF